MVKLQLVEIYAMSWRKRDVSILAPYLDDSFSYTSFGVYASLNRESYLDYLNGKFEALAKSGSNIDVSVGTNTIGDYAVVLRQDGEQPIYITIKEKDGKIAEACMLPF